MKDSLNAALGCGPAPVSKRTPGRGSLLSQRRQAGVGRCASSGFSRRKGSATTPMLCTADASRRWDSGLARRCQASTAAMIWSVPGAFMFGSRW
jgi:hypothetical protein